MSIRCSICNAPALADYVNAGLDKGLTSAGIAAGLAAAGGSLDPDVVSRHRKHYVPKPKPDAPKPTKRDLAVVVRDRMLDQIERMPVIEEEDGTQFDPLLNKHLAPAIGAGLKAQALLDKREAVAAKANLGAGLLALVERLDRLGAGPPVPQLEDGQTLEGEYKDVTPREDR